MRVQSFLAVMLMTGASLASAQVASHAPSTAPPLVSAHGASVPRVQVGDNPVVRVNGTVLTNRDLLRAMYTVFPYARQHNGFPKELEPEIRKAGLQIVIFEELVFQEAKRRGLTVSSSRLAQAETEFREHFPSQEMYQQFLKAEMRGSRQVLREKIRRSLLIEALLEKEVERKAEVSLAEAKAYYEENPKRFEHGETFSIQTISIIPPKNAGPEIQEEARRRAEEARRRAKETDSYQEFGLLAEELSDDDWRVNMGDRKQVDHTKLPPPLVAAAVKMKPGEVSDLLQFGPNYTLFRLNAHTPAGKSEFAEVKAEIQADLRKARYNQLRAELHKRLREGASVEVL